MPWTATINYIGAPGDTTEVSVIATDGVRKQQFRYQTDGTIANLRPMVIRSLAALDAQVVKSDLVLGQTIDISPIVPPPPPSDPDPARTKFFTDFSNFSRLKTLVDVGVVSADQTYADLLMVLQNAWKPSYLGF